VSNESSASEKTIAAALLSNLWSVTDMRVMMSCDGEREALDLVVWEAIYGCNATAAEQETQAGCEQQARKNDLHVPLCQR
jgi:hypothetical protein